MARDGIEATEAVVRRVAGGLRRPGRRADAGRARGPGARLHAGARPALSTPAPRLRRRSRRPKGRDGRRPTRTARALDNMRAALEWLDELEPTPGATPTRGRRHRRGRVDPVTPGVDVPAVRRRGLEPIRVGGETHRPTDGPRPPRERTGSGGSSRDLRGAWPRSGGRSTATAATPARTGGWSGRAPPGGRDHGSHDRGQRGRARDAARDRRGDVPLDPASVARGAGSRRAGAVGLPVRGRGGRPAAGPRESRRTVCCSSTTPTSRPSVRSRRTSAIRYDVLPRDGRPVIPVAFTIGTGLEADPACSDRLDATARHGSSPRTPRVASATSGAPPRERPRPARRPASRPGRRSASTRCPPPRSCEGTADILGWDVTEPAWQRRWLGDAAELP